MWQKLLRRCAERSSVPTLASGMNGTRSKVKLLLGKPFSYHLVGCLTVHVDPAKFLLVDRHKVVFCPAFRVIRYFQTHRCTGQQQFPALPGVFDMDGFHCAVHIYMGNKTVGAVKKNAVHDFSVFQCLLHFCLIRLRCPGINAAEDGLYIVAGLPQAALYRGDTLSFPRREAPARPPPQWR